MNQRSGQTQIPPRNIPIPATVSPQLQHELSIMVSGEAPELNVFNWLRFGGDEDAQIARIDALLQKTRTTMSEQRIADVPCFIVEPSATVRIFNRLLVSLHSGGYALGGGKGGTVEAILLAQATGCKVVAIDFRMPPQASYPAACDDVLAVWSTLTKQHQPSKMAICGSSSGGGLALSVVQRALSSELAIPAAIFAGTPWSDLSKTGDSYFTLDIGFGSYDGPLEVMAKAYAGSTDIRDPGISPVYGSFENFPPTLLVSGTRDLFLSNTVRVDQRLQEASAPSRLLVYEGHPHAIYLDPTIPESRLVFAQIAAFLDEHLS